MNWENGIIGKIPSNELLNIPFDVRRQNEPADALFGDEKTDNIIASWESINSLYQIPSMAYFHAFDTEAKTTYRKPIDKHNIEKGLIKVKINMSERLQALLNSGVRNDALFRYAFDDIMNLSTQVATRTKVAKNEVLATGKTTIKENNLNITIDYGVPTSNINYEIDFAKGADVFAQIQQIVDDALTKGVVLTGIYTSKSNLSRMRNHESVQKAINGVNAIGALVSNASLKNYLSEEFGINTIITNDNIYNADNKLTSAGKPSITTKRYYPADKITFFSTVANGRIGTGLWGDPPERLNALMSTKTSSESPYIHISQWSEQDPAVLWTKASAVFVPVLYNPSALFIATAKNSDDES